MALAGAVPASEPALRLTCTGGPEDLRAALCRAVGEALVEAGGAWQGAAGVVLEIGAAEAGRIEARLVRADGAAGPMLTLGAVDASLDVADFAPLARALARSGPAVP